MTQASRITQPVHVPGPSGPWDEVREAMARCGSAVVFTTWGEWLSAVVTEPRLRLLLGRDWPRYRRTADPLVRHRFAAARLVLKYTAAAALGTDAGELDLAYKIGGRPHLRGIRQVDVGLSHTGELIVVGVSRSGRIGVDAEPLTRTLTYDVMRERMCTPAERAALTGLDGPARTAALLRLWTLKEAYTKALGQGLRLDFTEFGFPPGAEGEFAAGNEAGLLAPDGSPAAPGTWSFGTYPTMARYLVAVARYDTGPAAAPGATERPVADERSMSLVAQLLPRQMCTAGPHQPRSGTA
ncbi:4'-phosphopantetheinyl transferase family protein [Streptomyces guryensis]|uniref:4'-phosphopantetheinyl transferase superfamily protein n=1 Tax=Streptomyces guryensis TaxID=2886947 RepID=A0A9Q3W1A7_9ACTN|nr:4'-phosphopantetheinyl transferase superfamily protein [Streptomyces guryensis]MCD9881046.1 4'-phosphopantetheinyl transferase superfamily protein [Streptomyces guryensis]